ncbi:hypothetical protein CTAYLR_001964 [Chrysophaeum taylorii]|uniref:Ankyrin repeat protein n=1 Tax=Chrysophaeum taylorii TaxID=2483200 RepID=A0AAD7UA73_9STRA|nr:hypothetical protein CTAYLR_001964 [Chrysophaeum taylorii]
MTKKSPLHANAMNLMAQRGETTALERAIQQGSDLNETDGDWFPLMMGVASNQSEVVKLLLGNGAKVDQTDEQGVSSLALAVQESHVECMRLLLEHGADVHQVNTVGTPPLVLAAHTGNIEVVELLLEHGADPRTGRTALHAAIRSSSTNVVERLLQAGADLDVVDGDGTPLLVAIRCNLKKTATPKTVLREALVSILLSGGADVNKQNGGETPLAACVDQGAAGLVQRLCDAGADPNDGSLLRVAGALKLTAARQVEIAEILLAHGARVDYSDDCGTKPLHMAVCRCRLALVRVFLQHGADANAAIEISGEIPAGFTPLRLATTVAQHEDREAIVNELVASRATEPLDELDLHTSEELVAWFRTLSWHGERTHVLLEKLEDLTPEQLFAMDETELLEEIVRDIVDPAEPIFENTDEGAAMLWYRKLQRHAKIQRDREQRARLGAALANENDDAFVPPLDDEERRVSVVDNLRAAAAAYNRACLLGDDEDETIIKSLDTAVATCIAEAERLRLARERCRAERYEALSERWSTLTRTTEATRPAPSKQVSVQPKRGESCFLREIDHIRVRAAAARPLLYGALSALLDEINAKPNAASLGLSSDEFCLPFADEGFLTVQGKRAALRPQPANQSKGAISAVIHVEDPYVMAVIVSALSQRSLPLRLDKVDFTRNDPPAVSLGATVLYPSTAAQHATTTNNHKHAFCEALAGVPLMTADIVLMFAQFATIAELIAPFEAVVGAADRRKFIFSTTLAFVDPDTWLPRTPEVVAAHHAARGRQLAPEDDDDEDRVALLERKLGSYADALAAAKANAASNVADLEASLRQRNHEIAQAREELARAAEAASARDDENRQLRDELNCVKATSLSSTKQSQLSDTPSFFDFSVATSVDSANHKPVPPPKNKTCFPSFNKPSRSRVVPEMRT